MSKYEPLTTYLKARAGQPVRLSFGDIEGVLGQKLPARSKQVRAWWSNNPSNNVMTRAWLAAGYRTAQVDVAGEMLSFVPSEEAKGFGEMAQVAFEPKPTVEKAKEPLKAPARHPAFGIWKGLVTLDPSYDYTQPADPDWGKVYEE